ncbi:hypothetical protein RHGRI_013765 [Rhododendron griersonianum]|uniref:Secreted protein n=1 Tax=Rhododendron griersonianum TaxID=479676 RepID=A0AAV6K7C1_9ERIC|nr:hypothetical protein RHGRI_013765 [Rhododendron griersonianum]
MRAWVVPAILVRDWVVVEGFWCSRVVSGCSAAVPQARRAAGGRVPEPEVSARLASMWSTRVSGLSAVVVCQCRCAFGYGCAGILSAFWISSPTRCIMSVVWGWTVVPRDFYYHF